MSKITSIDYLNRDYQGIKQYLVQLTKKYYPKTYNDFNQNSTGMMFIQLASVVGDILSYYTDYNFNENFIDNISQIKNLYKYCNLYGYKPYISTPSTTTLTLQLVVPNGVSLTEIPSISQGMVAKSNRGTTYIVNQMVDTAYPFNTSSLDQSHNIYTYTGIKATSGLQKQFQYTVGSSDNGQIIIPIQDQKYISIISVTEKSTGNVWNNVTNFSKTYVEVQKSVPNINGDGVQFIYEKKYTNKKYILTINDKGMYQIVFTQSQKSVYSTIPSANTTLIIKYLYGGGTQSNQESNTINTISHIQWINNHNTTDSQTSALIQQIKQSISINNDVPSIGGGGRQSLQTIKRNIKDIIQSQDRIVTNKDFVVRCYQMPSKYGRISKAYKEANNLYTLTFGSNGKLTNLNNTIKTNLKNYINTYLQNNMNYNLIDPYIIKLDIKIKISTAPHMNHDSVLAQCIKQLYNYFRLQNIDINKPIIMAQLQTLLYNVKGVMNVNDIYISHKIEQGDSVYYNIMDSENNSIQPALYNGIIYPPTKISIFYVQSIQDIKGV